MTDEIRELEDAFDRLLPPAKLQGRPSKELLDTGARWAAAVWREAERAGPAHLSEADVAWGLTLAPNAVFISGAHRSGTTLLRDLLDGHPALTALPAEGTFLTNLLPRLSRLPEAERLPALGREWVRRLANPINQPPYWLLGRGGAGASPYVEFARALMAWVPALRKDFGEMAEHVGTSLAFAWRTRGPDPAVRLWMEKTPTNERHLGRLRAAYPAAKVLHMVRDPLAVLASQKRLQEQVHGTFAARKQVLRDLETSFRAALDEPRRAPERFLLLRYEDLAAAPDEAMRRVAAFLGIEMLPILVEPTVAGLPARSNTAFAGGGVQTGITAASADGVSLLTREEREMAAAVLAPLAKPLGYALEAPPWWKAPLLRAKMLRW